MGAYGTYPVLMYINGDQESCIRQLFHQNNWILQLKELSRENISHLKHQADDSVLPFILRSEHLQTYPHFNPQHVPDSDVYCQQYQQQQHQQQHSNLPNYENTHVQHSSVEVPQHSNVSQYQYFDQNKHIQSILPHSEIQTFDTYTTNSHTGSYSNDTYTTNSHTGTYSDDLQANSSVNLSVDSHTGSYSDDLQADSSVNLPVDSHTGSYSDDLQADSSVNLPVSRIAAEQQSSFNTAAHNAALHTGTETNFPNDADKVEGITANLLHAQSSSGRLAEFPSEVNTIEGYTSAPLLTRLDSDRLEVPRVISPCSTSATLLSPLHSNYVRESYVNACTGTDYASEEADNVGVVVELTNARCALAESDVDVADNQGGGYINTGYIEDSTKGSHKTVFVGEASTDEYTSGYVNKFSTNHGDGFSNESGKAGLSRTPEFNAMIFTLDNTSDINAAVCDKENSRKCKLVKETMADDDEVTDVECSQDGFDSEGTESNIEDVESCEYGVRCYDFDGSVDMSSDTINKTMDLSRSEESEGDDKLRRSSDTDRVMDEQSIALASNRARNSRDPTAVDLSSKSRNLHRKWKGKTNDACESVHSTLVTRSATTEADVQQNESRPSTSKQSVDQSVHTHDNVEDGSDHKDGDSWTISPFSAGFRKENVAERRSTAGEGEDDAEKEASWIYSPFPREVDWEKLPPKATLCPYCNRIFASHRTLRPHIAEKHPKYAPTYKCHTCKLEFKYKPDLANHKKQTGHVTKAPPAKIVCELCGKSFAKKGYDVHMLTVHNSERNFYCSLCGKSFKSKGMLNAHERGVHDSAASTCNICHKKFKNNRRMLGHRLIHDKKNWRHVCKDCGRSFFSKENLEIHGRSHTGEKPFKCHLCTYACTCKQNLHKHMNVHCKQINS